MATKRFQLSQNDLKLSENGFKHLKCSRERTMQLRTNNATASEQHNRQRTTEPRTNKATASDRSRLYCSIVGCVVRSLLRCSFAVALFVRSCVVGSRLRCSFEVALFVRGCVAGLRLRCWFTVALFVGPRASINYIKAILHNCPVHGASSHAP